MDITSLLSDEAVIGEMGRRLAAARVARRLTHAQLAKAAGVSKRTVERLEDGASTQMTNLIRCLRALDLLPGLERLLPQTPVNPLTLLKTGAAPSRVRHAQAGPGLGESETTPWTWGDEK